MASLRERCVVATPLNQIFPGAPQEWQERLRTIVDMMREMSLQHDPQAMVRAYGRRMVELMPSMRRISLSRRDLPPGQVRVTRFSGWQHEVNPWKEPEKLPHLKGGLLAELIWADEPQILNDCHISPDDPSYEFLSGQRSIMAIPLFDKGTAQNMVVLSNGEPHGFSPDELPERVWMANLFGQATQNLVLAEQLEAAYQQVERELQVVADIQRSMLPKELPRRAGLEVSAHYQTSRQAGGDYYDFFNYPDDSMGILVADVSGHGTPSAVMMALTHCIAHMLAGPPTEPSELLAHLNDHLTSRYTLESNHFITAFFGIYHPRTRCIEYSSAGHNPPRLWRARTGEIISLENATSLPLGIAPDLTWPNASLELQEGDRLVIYTDGIVEAADPQFELFGMERLDDLIRQVQGTPEELRNAILTAVDVFTHHAPASDDRTLLVIDQLT